MSEGIIHNSFQIPLDWRAVLVEGAIFPFHRRTQSLVKCGGILQGPRIYRWVLKDSAAKIQSLYIGQSEAFHNRITGYRTPTKTNPNDTDVILSNAFAEVESYGGSVELEFLEIRPFFVNGQLIDQKSLRSQEVRLFLESLAIFTAKVEGRKLLNRLSGDAYEKAVFKLLDDVPKRKQMQVLESAIATLKDQVQKTNATQK